MNISRLSLGSMERAGGRNSQQRYTHDFVVDGLSLAKACEAGMRDLVGCIDALDASMNYRSISELVMTEGMPKRVQLFECPQCGDIGCGAITVRIEQREDIWVWEDFRYENNYDSSMTVHYPKVGPFYFAAEQYEGLLRGVMDAGLMKTAKERKRSKRR